MNDKVVSITKNVPPPEDDQLQCSEPCLNRAFTIMVSKDGFYTALCTACHHPAIVVAAEAVVLYDDDDDSEFDET